MPRVHHLNAGLLHAPPNPPAACHCLLVEGASDLVLIDTGIGLRDCDDPEGRIGAPTIAAAGFRFDPERTAFRQVERLGLDPEAVRDIVLTHADPDHAGGLADFPRARVHVSIEELDALNAGDPRYAAPQFAHGVTWEAHADDAAPWFGLPSRPLPLGPDLDARLVPLFGHTAGHCGVAIRRDDGRWLLHVGDAYYLRAERDTDDHPVSALAALRAHDDGARRRSLAALRRLAREPGDALAMLGYHDLAEFPPEARTGLA
jgi:glyoxylase-like metal-dependent hydrolase (beta-lactamase superfamily II)